MKLLDKEFTTNANQAGLQTFTQMKREALSNGKNVYLYVRTAENEAVFAYEVFIASVKKAGEYKLPGGKTITYTEDFEEYPGASKFGVSAWFLASLVTAEAKFLELTTAPVEKTPEPAIVGGAALGEALAPTKKGRGRPKGARPLLDLPDVEFSVKELAAKNDVAYPIAFVFLKEAEAQGTVKRTRTERRAAKGKPTQLFTKI